MIHSFIHGLGDCVMYRIVLEHLKALGHKVFVKTQPHFQCLFPPEYEAPISLEEMRPIKFLPHSWIPGWGDFPITKTTWCLMNELKIRPDIKLFRYDVSHIPIGKRPIKQKYAIVHGKGVSLPRQKNLLPPEIGAIKEKISRQGLLPIEADCSTVEELATLIHHSQYVVGIDSGVEHLSLALGKRTHVVFKEHHPYNHFEPCGPLISWICPLSTVFVHHGEPDLSWHKANYEIKKWEQIEDVKL